MPAGIDDNGVVPPDEQLNPDSALSVAHVAELVILGRHLYARACGQVLSWAKGSLTNTTLRGKRLLHLPIPPASAGSLTLTVWAAWTGLGSTLTLTSGLDALQLDSAVGWVSGTLAVQGVAEGQIGPVVRGVELDLSLLGGYLVGLDAWWEDVSLDDGLEAPRRTVLDVLTDEFGDPETDEWGERTELEP